MKGCSLALPKEPTSKGVTEARRRNSWLSRKKKMEKLRGSEGEANNLTCNPPHRRRKMSWDVNEHVQQVLKQNMSLKPSLCLDILHIYYIIITYQSFFNFGGLG